MDKEQIKDLQLYMNTIGIESSEDWFTDSENYDIGDNTLVVGIWWALDDKTGTKFNSLGEIVGFYGLPMLPENVRNKEELEEYKRVIGLNS
jgi:hypothetical protein